MSVYETARGNMIESQLRPNKVTNERLIDAFSRLRRELFVPEVLRYTVEPMQRALFGRMLIEPEVIRMLLFGLALVLMMLYRPAGILPSALRKRELEVKR
jgi:protein-L-isoaspartate O-methyltransferase